MNRVYFKNLDGLRAIAVALVLFAHGGFPFPRSGGVGVDIFFVLSGFLITMILSAEAGRNGKINFRNFYCRRCLRLAPCLLLVCTSVVLARAISDQPLQIAQIGVVLSYTANWARALFEMDLGALTHCWSLAIEEQFYLLWPLVILVLERSSKRPMTKGSILLCLSLTLALYRFSLVGSLTAERLYFGLDTHMDGLVMGSALTYFVKAIQDSGGLGEVVSKLLGRLVVPASIVVLVGIMATITWLDPRMSRYGFLLAALASSAIIADLVVGRHCLITRPLQAAPAVFIGRISYGLYLWHLPIFVAIESMFPDSRFLVKFPFKLGVSVIVATASYYLFERYFLRLKSRFETPDSRGKIPAQENATGQPFPRQYPIKETPELSQ
jgi:peptidoglycan/LPS O-acetylase OafA/YrhL